MHTMITYLGTPEGVFKYGGVVMLNGVHASIDDTVSSLPAWLFHRKYPASFLRQLRPSL
jgi:hypothetical protein